VVAAVEQRACEVGADEASATGDKCPGQAAHATTGVGAVRGPQTTRRRRAYDATP
jgi:hypothetical protein